MALISSLIVLCLPAFVLNSRNPETRWGLTLPQPPAGLSLNCSLLQFEILPPFLGLQRKDFRVPGSNLLNASFMEEKKEITS